MSAEANAVSNSPFLQGAVKTLTGWDDAKLAHVLKKNKEGNFISDWANKYGAINQKYQEASANAVYDMGGGVWNTAHNMITNIVENIPNTVLSVMTGGMNAAGGLATTQRMAMDALKNAGITKGMLETLVQTSFKDPQYWTSLMQEIGSDYETVCQYSDDPFVQGIMALFVGLVNARIEIGADGQSGIQGIGQEGESGLFGKIWKAVAGGRFGFVGEIIDDATDETLEEVKQKMIVGLTVKSVTGAVIDPTKPLDWLVSNDNKDAVIYTPEMAE